MWYFKIKDMVDAKEQIEKLLARAQIKINGSNDFDMEVFDERLYRRVLSGGSLALGESYMDGWWEAKALDQFFYKILKANIDQKFVFSLPAILLFIKSFVFNLQTQSRSFTVGRRHYDIGNDLYQAMLGKTMAYSCAYWSPPFSGIPLKAGKAAQNQSTQQVDCSAENSNKKFECFGLDEAQMAKFDLICRKIGLKKGDKILDIGCGWGSFLKFAVENYGAEGIGITVSKEQVVLAKEICKNLPIEIRLQDYRNLNSPLPKFGVGARGKFDHIVSIGMFEHVGVKNYRVFMSKVHELLKDNGLFLLHTIGSNQSSVSIDPWLAKYIFPNSMIPSMVQITKSIEGLFIVEDWHNFGADYDKTLMAWFDNFNKNWTQLKSKYSERFYRMWKYYLLSCAGNFRTRYKQLWQVVLSKKGVPGGYKSKR